MSATRSAALVTVGYLSFAVLGGAFAVGWTFSDPGGAAALGLTALWVVPSLALAVLALLRPRPMLPVLRVATWAVAGLVVVESVVTLLPGTWGPATAVAALGLGTALACLGRAEPLPAARLLLLTATAQLLSVLASFALHAAGVLPPGPGTGGAAAMLVSLVLALTALAFLGVADRPQAEELSLSLSTARPASSRATGTRNGEQDT